MKSMTGYAYSESFINNAAASAADSASASASASVEIKGYNNRFLEVSVTFPYPAAALEGKVKEAVSLKCARGKVEVLIRTESLNSGFALTVNKDAALAYNNAWKSLSELFKSNDNTCKEKLNITELMKMPGVIELKQNAPDTDNFWREIEPLFIETIDKFDRDRKREGAHTEADILIFLSHIEESAKMIAKIAPAEEENMHNEVKAKLNEISGNIHFDENRLLTEAGILVMKQTIHEERSRLEAHFAEFYSEAKNNETPGKKLDFLCQEMNREVNTIASKSTSIEVRKAVISMKEMIENIREQLRNVE
jgi:uncharacterized protein (TIGR00255 family)